MAKRKLNIELLKRLKARFVRMRHSGHFNMEYVAEKTECGTAMCIAGHALQIQGYKFKFDEYGVNRLTIRPNGQTLRASHLSTAAREMGMPYGDWPLGATDAYDLFNDLGIRTPKQAAARIQELIDSAEVNQS